MDGLQIAGKLGSSAKPHFENDHYPGQIKEARVHVYGGAL